MLRKLSLNIFNVAVGADFFNIYIVNLKKLITFVHYLYFVKFILGVSFVVICHYNQAK